MATPALFALTLRRARRTKCLVDADEEMAAEELRLRGSALLLIVAGSRLPLVPVNIAECLTSEFPDLPASAFQVSLYHASFFVRFRVTSGSEPSPTET
jgi:hypothetical protein